MKKTEEEKSGAERRRAPRDEVYFEATISFENERHEVIVSNISRVGALIYLEISGGSAEEEIAPLKVDGVLDLSIPSLSVANVTGRIVRVRPVLGGFSIAAEFERFIEVSR